MLRSRSRPFRHGTDLAYLWPSAATPLNDEEKRLSLEIVRHHGEFVKSGRPHARGQAN